MKTYKYIVVETNERDSKADRFTELHFCVDEEEKNHAVAGLEIEGNRLEVYKLEENK